MLLILRVHHTPKRTVTVSSSGLGTQHTGPPCAFPRVCVVLTRTLVRSCGAAAVFFISRSLSAFPSNVAPLLLARPMRQPMLRAPRSPLPRALGRSPSSPRLHTPPLSVFTRTHSSPPFHDSHSFKFGLTLSASPLGLHPSHTLGLASAHTLHPPHHHPPPSSPPSAQWLKRRTTPE